MGDAAGNFNFNRLGTGGYDAAGNNLSQTGDPFASFLLGQVHDANQTIYVQPTFNESYIGAVDQRRVQGQRQAHADRSGCASTTSRPAPRRTTSTPRSIRTRPTLARAAVPAP